MTKIKAYKHGTVTMEHTTPSGLYVVTLRLGTEVHNRIRTDDGRTAREYFAAFCRIAKTH